MADLVLKLSLFPVLVAVTELCLFIVYQLLVEKKMAVVVGYGI